MGGPVKIAVSDDNGKVSASVVYTSCICGFFDDVRFIHQDIFHSRRYLIDARYDNDETLSPYGYGLVFADAKTKKIHSMQGYTSVGEFSSVGCALSADGVVLTDDPSSLDHNRFFRLHSAGYIKCIRDPYGDSPDIDISKMNSDDALAVFIKQHTESKFGVSAKVEYGYEYISYDESLAGSRAMYRALKADGVKFTAEDNVQWAATWDEMAENEEDDTGSDELI